MTEDRGKPLSQRPKVRQILETAIYVQDVRALRSFITAFSAFPIWCATNAGNIRHSSSHSSMAVKIGCSAHEFTDRVKKIEVDNGKRVGSPSDVVETMKASERENCQFH